MGSEPPVRLLDLEPDLIRYLTPEQRKEARSMLFPIEAVPHGDFDVRGMFDETNAFGGILLDGMLVQQLRLGGHVGVRLLGPGDFIGVTNLARSALISDSVCRALLETRLALLGYDLLAATHRWPMLVAGLQARNAEQSERVIAQLMICQLPRVDDRVLAIFWFLAETWGHVTPHGTLLPLSLTHELIGLLIGARRPTVSLALRDLAERGALLKQDAGWLLVEKPAPAERGAHLDDPHLVTPGVGWKTDERHTGEHVELPHVRLDQDALRERFVRQREQHQVRVTAVSARLAELRASRERNRQQRQRIRAEVRRRSAPSS